MKNLRIIDTMLDHRINIGIDDPDHDKEIQYKILLMMRLVNQRHRQAKSQAKVKKVLEKRDRILNVYKELNKDLIGKMKEKNMSFGKEYFEKILGNKKIPEKEIERLKKQIPTGPELELS